MNDVLQQLRDQVAGFGPNLLAGVAVLVVGWLVALLAAFLTRKALSKVSLDNKIARWVAGPERKTDVPIELWAGRAVFYLIMLVVAIAFMQTVKLTTVSEPLNVLLQPLLSYLPHLLGGGLLIVVAWLLATVLRGITAALLKATKLDEKLGGTLTGNGKPVGLESAFPEVVYWLVFLVFLPAILHALQLEGLLTPVTALFNKVFAFLPNIVSAAAIATIGWFVARIVQRILQSLLASAGVDRLSEKWGLAASLGKQQLSRVLALVVYFIILVPVLISALDALKLEAFTKPASDMLGKILGALPNIFGALLVILLAVVIGKVVSGIVSNVLAGLGFNSALVKLGLAKRVPEGKQTPSSWMGMIAFVIIILLAAVNATDLLGFPALGSLIREFITFAGHIVAGMAILGLGLLLAQIVATGINSSDSPYAPRLALFARVIILALAGAMALRQTGLANEIVNLAFGLTLGAAAVAFALAFGLGGKDIAARTLEDWRDSVGKGDPQKPIIPSRQVAPPAPTGN
jgi:hypothetical protein